MGDTFNRVALGVATGGTSELIRGQVAAVQAGGTYVAKKIDETTGAKAAREQAADQEQKALDAQNKLVQDAQDQRQQQLTDAANQNRIAAEKQRMAIASAGSAAQGSRSSTLLTGALGITDPATTARKTILGG